MQFIEQTVHDHTLDLMIIYQGFNELFKMQDEHIKKMNYEKDFHYKIFIYKKKFIYEPSTTLMSYHSPITFLTHPNNRDYPQIENLFQIYQNLLFDGDIFTFQLQNHNKDIVLGQLLTVYFNKKILDGIIKKHFKLAQKQKFLLEFLPKQHHFEFKLKFSYKNSNIISTEDLRVEEITSFDYDKITSEQDCLFVIYDLKNKITKIIENMSQSYDLND